MTRLGIENKTQTTILALQLTNQTLSYILSQLLVVYPSLTQTFRIKKGNVSLI